MIIDPKDDKFGGLCWKSMDEIDLHAFIGLLILAGVNIHEARLHLVSGMQKGTTPLKDFHTFSRMIRFDSCESRPARRVTDKLAAIGEVWDTWVKRLLSDSLVGLCCSHLSIIGSAFNKLHSKLLSARL